MLTIDLGSLEYFNSSTNEFEYEHGGTIRFEYSLKAVYEWEGIWKKPFLKGELTYIEMLDLYKCMALDVFDIKFINEDVSKTISNYISSTNTATIFSETQSNTKTSSKAKINTSEEIYATMFSAGIPLEFENRNLNRLLAILRIISVNNNPPKKMNKNDVMKQNSELNRQRKAQMKSSG